MKNLKITLATMLAMVVLPISTCVFAYNGTDVDTKYEINMPAVLSNGEGVVTSAKSGNFKYQFVETTAAKYSTLKKLAAQLDLMKAYQAGEFENWENAEANENYKAKVTNYESTYNEKVSSLYTQYGSFDSNSISDVRSLWIHELPNFVAGNWVSSSDKKVSLDLTTFTGTKYYVAWVQLGDMYDAEVYVVEGKGETKQPEEQKSEEQKPEEQKPEEQKPEETKQNTTNTSKTNNTGSKTTTTATKLPKTGATGDVVILGGIALSTLGGAVSYRKYRNIK